MTRAPEKTPLDRNQRASGESPRLAGAHLVAAVIAAVAVVGCAGVHQSISSWFAETPPPEPTAAAARMGQIYYAGGEGLTVHAEPSGSSKIVGHLARYERVTRSRLERGYAYVAADKSGLEGWVDNAQLLWRLPASEPDENEPPKAESPSTGASEAAQAEPTAAKGAPAAELTPTSTPETPPASPTPTPQAALPTPPPTRAVTKPAIFDPF